MLLLRRNKIHQQRNHSATISYLPVQLFYFFNHSYLLLIAELWKSPEETTQIYSVSETQSSSFSAASKFDTIGFSAKTGTSTVTNSPIYRPIRTSAQTKSFLTSINEGPNETKKEATMGCRLFGIQLIESAATEEISPVVTISSIAEDQPLTSLIVDSDRQSQPSNVNRSDNPAISSEVDKSCLKSPQETYSRQTRSCTKVTKTSLFLLCCPPLNRTISAIYILNLDNSS